MKCKYCSTFVFSNGVDNGDIVCHKCQQHIDSNGGFCECVGCKRLKKVPKKLDKSQDLCLYCNINSEREFLKIVGANYPSILTANFEKSIYHLGINEPITYQKTIFDANN